MTTPTLYVPPTQICGYCLTERTTSTCECRSARWVRAARAAELAGRLVVERQGVAGAGVGHAPPTSRAMFRSR